MTLATPYVDVEVLGLSTLTNSLTPCTDTRWISFLLQFQATAVCLPCGSSPPRHPCVKFLHFPVVVSMKQPPSFSIFRFYPQETNSFKVSAIGEEGNLREPHTQQKRRSTQWHPLDFSKNCVRITHTQTIHFGPNCTCPSLNKLRKNWPKIQLQQGD